MTSPPPSPNSDSAEQFCSAANDWDLERLYADLAQAKQELTAGDRETTLTPVEKTYLRGLLCRQSPDEIAAQLYRDPGGVRVALSRSLYRYVEILTDRDSNELKRYSDIPDWLAEAGYNRKTLTQGQDWGEAPEIALFYGRTEPLKTLKEFILDQGCRIVSVVGMGGIGKTALAVTLVKQMQVEFEYIIWRSLRNRPSLNGLLADWMEFFPQQSRPNSRENTDDRISFLLDYLRQHRCLLVLDNLEAILREGDRAGQYREGYEEYGELFQRLGRERHNSCLLLTTWETPADIALLETAQQPVRSYILNGLEKEAVHQWFQELGLSDPEDWNPLRRQYGGNPLWLNIVVSRIKDLFGGSVSQLFTLDTILIGDPVKQLLDQQFNRLSEPEKQMMYYLAGQEGAVSIQQLREHLNFQSGGELIEVLTSLRGRFLIEKSTKKEGYFILQTVLKRYVVKEYSQECDRFGKLGKPS